MASQRSWLSLYSKSNSSPSTLGVSELAITSSGSSTNAQTRVFETALTLAGIAHQLVGTVRFTDRAEVKDALAYLKVVVNPADRIAFARAANTPRRKLGDVSLNAFFAACDDGIENLRETDDFEFLLDIRRSRSEDGATPLPIRPQTLA